MMPIIERYKIFESYEKEKDDRAVWAEFTHADKTVIVKSFSVGDGCVIRFMPTEIGEWSYTTHSGGAVKHGSFVCTERTGDNHGMVETSEYSFRYADGTRYIPFGTTCYAWTHQPIDLIKATLKTLKKSPFNKVRMGVFPKSMAYNNNDPEFYPFEKTDGKWDVDKPCESFWQRFERCIAALDALGIEADVILFHPYDRWGFASLGRDDCLKYLDYCVRRLSAYKNVWWSLANEYELLLDKTYDDWDAFAQRIKDVDIYGHLISIHNFCKPYPKRDWMTHCSIQSAQTELALLWRSEYGIPVIDDECGYEGNLEFGWGNLTAFELINRMWTCIVNGGYCTHGETFHRDDEIIWWAKGGGKLIGKAVPRIAFLKKLLEEIGDVQPLIRLEYLSQMEVSGQGTEFMQAMKDLPKSEQDRVTVSMIPKACGNDKYRLFYYGSGCPLFVHVASPDYGEYKVETIDVWTMARTVVCEKASGDYTVKLPAKGGMAVLLTKI